MTSYVRRPKRSKIHTLTFIVVLAMLFLDTVLTVIDVRSGIRRFSVIFDPSRRVSLIERYALSNEAEAWAAEAVLFAFMVR